MLPPDGPPDSAQATPLRIDRYEIESVLGRGGFGTVYQARHILTKQRVALKVLRMAAIAAGHGAKDIVREAQIMGAIKHKNIVSVYDAGISDGMAFFAMELVLGPTLEQLLQSHGPMPVLSALPIALQLADGLGAAHAMGIVHRDIKPANLVVLSDGTLKILDFGISRSSFVSSTAPSQKALAGTPGYMAPEQFGDGPVDHRADLYAAAATLYQLTTGSMPFPENNFADLLTRITHEDAPKLAMRLPSAPAFFANAVDRGLARSPGDRFQSAEELRAALGGRTSFHTPTIGGMTPSGTAATIASFPPNPAPSFGNPLVGSPPSIPSNPPPQLRPQSFAPAEPAQKRGSPVTWAVLGGGLVALVLFLGVAVGAGFVLYRGRVAEPAGAPAQGSSTPLVPHGVVIGPVTVIERTGTFTTTQSCRDNQTIRFTSSVFEVKKGPAIVVDENCDLELVDCDIHAPIGITGSHGSIKIRGGTIKAGTVAIDVEMLRLDAERTKISAPWGIRTAGPGNVRLSHVTITSTETALNIGQVDLDFVESELVAPLALKFTGPGRATLHGGRVRGAKALLLEGIVEVLVEGATVDGPITKAPTVTVRGM